MLLNVCMDLLLCDVWIMLSRKDNCLQTLWIALLIIFHCNLRLAVRPQVLKRPIFTDLCKPLSQLMCKRDRVRHKLRSLIRSITEHHTLIPRSGSLDLIIVHLILFRLKRLVNAQCNVGGLLVNRRDHSTSVRIKSIFPSRVTDLPYCFTDNLLDIHISAGRNLAHHKDKPCRDRRLAGHAAHWILLYKRIQDRIRYLIAHLIRMPLCHRFRSKQ